MITAYVQFKLPAGTTLEQSTAIFESTAPRYRSVPGLIRKYYLHDPATDSAGGCYLFETRALAEASFDDAWHALIAEKYGAAPEVKYFETPVIVDNAAGAIETASAA